MAPVGADLTLHALAALPAFLSATLLGRLPIAAALNLTTLASLTLNGVCAYLLAWSRAIAARRFSPASSSASPYRRDKRSLQPDWRVEHPLFALTFIEAVRGRLAFAGCAGAVAAATAYVDYYYVVYNWRSPCILLLEAIEWSLRVRAAFPPADRHRRHPAPTRHPSRLPRRRHGG
jgi:hypothetical protein